MVSRICVKIGNAVNNCFPDEAGLQQERYLRCLVYMGSVIKGVNVKMSGKSLSVVNANQRDCTKHQSKKEYYNQNYLQLLIKIW